MPPTYIHSANILEMIYLSIHRLSICLTSTYLLTDIYLTMVKNIEYKIYQFNHFLVYSSDVLIIFTLFCNRSLELLQLAKLNLCTH